METVVKKRRKRIIRPSTEVIAVPIDSDSAISACDGCCFYDELKEECKDDGSHNCAGVIYKLK